MRALALGAVTALVACGAPGPDARPAAPSPVAGLSLVPAPGGLDVAGSGGREIGFGRARDGALATAARIAGRAPRPVPCGAGREGQSIGADLVMVFTDGAFSGWQTPGRSAGTACT